MDKSTDLSQNLLEKGRKAVFAERQRLKFQILFEREHSSNYVTMRTYIYDVQPENKHCLELCSNIFLDVEADISFPPNML